MDPKIIVKREKGKREKETKFTADTQGDMGTSNPPDSPTQFGRYTLLRPLATGGMGEVFLAKAVGVAGFQKSVVIKKILPHLANDENFVRRFIDEARLVVTLSHANIVQVFDMGKEEGAYFIAMEFVDGVDLRVLLKVCRNQQISLPLNLALYVLAEVSAGLDYAHNRQGEDGKNLQIVHRDISPSNVMLSKDGAVKLVDFGVAKSTSRLNNSLSGSLRGKVRYMSPEQANGETLTNASDVFSLGVMGYELLTGKRLFDGESDLKTLDQVRHGKIPTISANHPDIPTPVALLIEACLARNPVERPNADNVRRDLLGQLHELTHGEGITAQDLGKFVRESLSERKEEMSLSDALDLQLEQQGREGGGHTATFLGEAEGWKPSLPGAGEDISSSWPSTEITAQQTANVKSLTSMVRVLVGAVVILLVVNVFFFIGGKDRPSEEPLTAEESLNPAENVEKALESEALVLPTPPLTKANSIPQPQEEVRKEERRLIPEEPEREKRMGVSEAPATKVIQLNPSPPTARVFVNGAPVGSGSQKIQVKAGESVRVSVKEKGFKTGYTTLTAESRDRINLTLSKAGTGMIRFRFFPANAKVYLDGKELQLGGTNLVEKSLPIGQHTVEIIGADETLKTKRTFEIKAEQVEQLGTLKL